MAVKKSVTFDEFIWDTYLSDYKGNFSKHIQRLVVLGYEGLMNKQDQLMKRAITLVNQNEELEKENKLLRSKLSNLEGKLKKGTMNFELSSKDIEILEECKRYIEKMPETLNGNFNRFKNASGHNDMTLKEFKELINGDKDENE